MPHASQRTNPRCEPAISEGKILEMRESDETPYFSNNPEWQHLYDTDTPFSDKWLGENALSYSDALKRCRQLKSQGWDLFRGQITNTNIVPTGRRKKADKERLLDFMEWVRRQPELKDIHEEPYQVSAVAQHDGIHTPLLDFTRDPKIAGFFSQYSSIEAAKIADNELRPSVIICAKSKSINNLLRSYSSIIDNRHPLYGIPTFAKSIPVPNIRRIRAQKSVFVLCYFDDYDIDIALDFHRIYYPPVAATSQRLRSKLFPPHRTKLERVIDRYFRSSETNAC
jgi:hypothetical protein